MPFICNDYNENSNYMYCMARYILLLYSFIPVHVFQRSVEVLSWVVRFGASADKRDTFFVFISQEYYIMSGVKFFISVPHADSCLVYVLAVQTSTNVLLPC